MTLLQIRYACECQRSMSISTAADALFTSVSNVSKNLKSLEDELGFPIFSRSPHGLIPTARGRLALDHFQTILKECSEIELLSSGKQKNSFVLASLPIFYTFEAFSRLAGEFPADNTGLKYHSTSSAHALARLRNHLCDAALVGCLKGSEDHEIAKYKKLGIRLEPVRTISLAVYLREEHPLILSGLTDEEILHELIRYSYVEFNDDIYLTLNPVRTYIDPENIIKVNDRDWRFSLLKQSDCFSSGICADFVTVNHPGIRQIPLPDAGITLLYALQDGAEESDPVKRYRELIRS